jgi:hypothetical protein
VNKKQYKKRERKNRKISSLEKSSFSPLLTFKNMTFLKKSLFLENMDIVICLLSYMKRYFQKEYFYDEI